MANIETALLNKMTGHAGLAALVGNRVYPGKMPETPTYPCVVYYKVSITDVAAHGRTNDILQPRFQFNVWALTYASAKLVKEQIWQCLHNWGPATQNGVSILDAVQETENDVGSWDDAVKVYGITTDYLVSHIKE